MYNTKFILKTGKEIYPGYLDKEKRKELKSLIGDKKGFMKCGCKPEKDLFYRLSEDLKIYPEHNGYMHDQNCSRYKAEDGKTERKTAYLVNEENGEVTTFLKFNPKIFNLNEEEEVEEIDTESLNEEEEEIEHEEVIEKDENTTKKVEKKEPKLSLAGLIRSINVDSFTEKVVNGISIDSNISKYVFSRMKKIKVSRMKKSLGELSLEADGVKFFYLPFAGAVNKEEYGLQKCYMCTFGPDGKIFNNLIFPDTFEKVRKEFVKNYGIEPNNDTMIAGFQYYKKSKKGINYRVLGRVHLFQTSKLGIYCRSLVEKDAFDAICDFVNENNNLSFWIPPDDETIGGILQVKDKNKKILLLFRGKKNEIISFNDEDYIPLVVGLNEPVTKDRLYDLINELS